ncbi:hypothetical protein [Tahibacter amnicola]|uniref:Uncharacterized protein n=1 Tax=Tahibacter amnicola TaxID=2976241 RepID=A0ABY6B9E3_9GAMM|nr:hypothetical protein [Tahibacter amnicola]UXI66681.1 hypothetical protein N4264_18255 [Tahibacter amnicola]
MSHRFLSVFAAFGLTVAALAPAQADTLLMQRAKEEHGAMPGRGLSMAQVESRFGAPKAKLDPRGGDSAKHPVINRWEYDGYIVYFERDKVIDTVMKKASPTEQGPATRR